MARPTFPYISFLFVATRASQGTRINTLRSISGFRGMGFILFTYFTGYRGSHGLGGIGGTTRLFWIPKNWREKKTLHKSYEIFRSISESN